MGELLALVRACQGCLSATGLQATARELAVVMRGDAKDPAYVELDGCNRILAPDNTMRPGDGCPGEPPHRPLGHTAADTPRCHTSSSTSSRDRQPESMPTRRWRW